MRAPVTPPDPTRRFPLEETLLAVAVIVNALVVLLAHHFPYQDEPNHIARYVLMDRFWSGHPPANIDVRVVPGPYLAIDLVGVALVRLIGPGATGKVLALVAVVLLPLAMYALLRRAAPAQRGWALVGALMAFSWFVLAGMLNFAIGVGLALAWLAWWWPTRAEPRTARTALLALGAAALFTVHMAAALTTLVIMWMDVALAAGRRSRQGARPLDAVRAPQLPTALGVTAAVVAVWAWATVSGGAISGTPVFRSVGSKVAALGAPFYSVSLAQAGVMAAGYGAALLAFWRANPDSRRLSNTFVASATACLVCFLVFPKDIGGAGGTDVRWLIPMYLLPFCAAGVAAATPTAARRNRQWLWVPFTAWLVNTMVLVAVARAFDRRLDAYDAALRAVPPGARLLPLLSDQREFPRVGPYQQYAFWHTVRRGGQVPALWSAVGTREGDPEAAHLRHFSVRKLLYYPQLGWGNRYFTPLDWARISREYDYIIQYSDADSVRAYVRAHAREVAHAGDVYVFQVVSPR